MLMLAASMIMADSANEKYTPGGVNSLVVNMPNMYGPMKAFDMHPDAKKYFIRNIDDGHKGDRFYLASPCKSRLTLTKAMCDCTGNPMNHRYDFGGGLQDIQSGSIALKDGLNSAQSEVAQSFYDWITSPESVMIGVEFKDEWYNLWTAAPERTGTYSATTLFEAYDKYFDTSKAIKKCDTRDTIGGLMDWVKMDIDAAKNLFQGKREVSTNVNYFLMPSYHVDCFEVTVDTSAFAYSPNYCFDNFPELETTRSILTLGSIAVDIYLGGLTIATAGGATPLLFASGIAFGVIDQVLEKMEKWP